MKEELRGARGEVSLTRGVKFLIKKRCTFMEEDEDV
jgi:hypothetical protein